VLSGFLFPSSGGLGHGFAKNEKTPKVIEALRDGHFE